MAKLLAKTLTSQIKKKIATERNDPKTNEVVVLCSVDKAGYPHFSLLNFLDIAVATNKKIVFAVGKSSSTAKNMIDRGRATFAFWMDANLGSLVYLKGTVRRGRFQTANVEGFETSPFIMTLQSVLEDASPKSKVLSTLTYGVEKINPDHLELSKQLSSIALKLRY
ncbi:MAG TPA: pyridoxamine 5'-phosphate oxidase family protein [Nitrososphaerales archaeon]|nr:pyridoxamine 5'-phosphate oxidase family protein [Nitrososphaerales archaeon]